MPINEQIRVAELMVIGTNGEQMGVKALKDALTLANYAGLDLVLMSGDAKPAVGKIMDYNKYRYEKQKRLKESQKKQRESNKDINHFIKDVCSPGGTTIEGIKVLDENSFHYNMNNL